MNKKNKKISFSVAIFLGLIIFLAPVKSLADTPAATPPAYCLLGTVCQPKLTDASGNEIACADQWQGSKEVSKCPCPNGKPGDDCIPIVNPLKNNETSLFNIFGIIIRTALGIIGSLTLLMLVWGGFLWLTSAGNPERVKKGTDTMLWATIGVIIVFSSYFVLSNFTKYLTNPNTPNISNTQ